MEVSVTVLVMAFVAGLVLGVVNFGGLWMTVRAMAGSARPGVLFAMSFVVRMSIVAAGFYLVMGGEWQRLLACVVGFFLMRVAFARVLGPEGKKGPDRGGEGGEGTREVF